MTGIIHLDVTNSQYFPVEILGARIGDSELTFLVQPEVIQTSITYIPDIIQSISLVIPSDIDWDDSMINDLKIDCKILGSSRLVEETVFPYPIIDQDVLANDYGRQKENISSFDFLSIDDLHQRILIESGKHQLKRNLVIPEGYQVMAKEGTEIQMSNGANIISYSPLHLIGSKERPIIISSIDSTAQGIVVINTKERSKLHHVQFNNLSKPVIGDKDLGAAVTFDRAPVDINHCFFGNNREGDDYLKVILTNYLINNTTFFNANRNAFAGNYSTGKIRNSQFIKAGNDAIDLTGCFVIMENVRIDRAANKGLSADRKTTLEGRRISVQNADIAMDCRDLSKVLITGMTVQDTRIAYAVYQKDPAFGPAWAEIDGYSNIKGQTEKDSSCRIREYIILG